MAERLKRASFARIAVGMAALALPLFAVGTAQAAIAGAPAESTINRPDLVSATALTGTTVDYCFDRALNNGTFTPANFTIGGYRANRVAPVATSVVLEQTFNTTNQCVRVTFPATIGDIGQYTYAGVAANAVQTTGLLGNPFPDSTTLTVPASLNPTHNGTTGFTVAPDLVSVTTDITPNTITYTEDQALTGAPLANNFTFTRSGGTICHANTATVSGNTVTAVFNAAPTGLNPNCPVSDAQRAGQILGAVSAAADPGIPSPPETAIVPNTTGNTAAPDLISATLSADGSGVDYVFDKSVSVVGAGTGFEIVLSNGAVLASTGATVTAISTTSTTVHAVFTLGGAFSSSQFNEYIVVGAVLPGAVIETSPPLIANVADARPAGDNAGAFARGFTTAPDVTSAIVNKTTGQVSVTLDQRAFLSAPAGFVALDNTGNMVATAAAGSVAIPTQAAGPQTITVQFSPGQVSAMANLHLGPALESVIGIFEGEPNVAQTLAVTSTATLLHRAAYARAHKMSKHQINVRRAQVRRQERRLLKKEVRQLHQA